MTIPDERPGYSPEREDERFLEGGIERQSLERQTSEPVPKQEPLFNKKVMILWALGALAVWMAVQLVLPEVKATARDAVIQRVKEAEQTSGGRVKVRTRGGVITITTDQPRSATEAQPAKPAAPGGTQPATAPTPETPKPPPAGKR